MNIISTCSTVVYVISFMSCSFLLEKLEDKDAINILEFVLLATLIYLIIQMETVGSIFLNIFLQQFDFELINDSF